MEIRLTLEPELALFYTRVASLCGKQVDQVIRDALFLLAGELSLEALEHRQENVK